MLRHATLEQLQELRLHGMAQAFEEQLQMPELEELSFEERLGLLVEREATERASRRLTSRLRRAKLREQAAIEDIDWRARRGLDKRQILTLASCRWIADHLNVLLTGKAGVGKTFLASALGHSACRAGKSVLFLRADQLFQLLHQSRADHTTEKVRRRLLAPDVLIVDDFGLRRLNAEQSSDFYEMILERHRRSSTILTSNRAIEEWSPLFDDPMLGQSALDRLAHNAYQIPIEGPSYREQQRPGVKSSKPRQARRR